MVAAVLGIGSWAAFAMYATNLERASAAVTRQVLRTIQRDERIQSALGGRVEPEPNFWYGNVPYIDGSVREVYLMIRLLKTLR